MQDISKEIHYSKNYIYFILSFYKLVEKFEKLKYISLPLTFVKNNLKLIRKIVHSEPDFWKNKDS